MGIKQFFKNAFGDMKESAKAQHQVSKAEFNAAKAESRARYAEAKAMGRRDTRLALEQRRRDEQIVAANARTAEAEARIAAVKKK